ncbi:MAG: hypothetical protein KDA36_03460 [Planctomycetaceae bacterium]|nr:hypothetical protein [Planctomycetaceae bacterium]
MSEGNVESAVMRLEDRTLLAGNVTAAITGGNLVIQGDDLSNTITIEPTANAGEFKITGTGTTVNGAANVTLGGLTGDIIAQMGDGNDQVQLSTSGTQDITLPGAIRGEMGEGNNVFKVFTLGASNLKVSGDATFTSGAGNDNYIFQSLGIGSDLTFDANVSVTAGEGTNGTTLETSNNNSRVDVGLKLTVKGGSGSDSVQFLAQGNVSTVSVRNAVINPGDGTNEVRLESNADSAVAKVIESFRYTGGAGADTILLQSNGSAGQVKFGTSTKVKLGGGANTFTMEAPNVAGFAGADGNLSVKGGNDIDQVKLLAAAAGRVSFAGTLKMSLGGGNDTLRLGFVKGVKKTKFNGGSGTNTLTDDGNNQFTIPPVFSGF